MKKFLSLVLALVMTMSLVTISAGAAEFTDDSSIDYSEAVDVMQAIEVVGGYPDGSFKPTNTLTRGAAAKIICNMILGPTTAEALVATTAPYSDVAANSTFAGYIAYCKNQGIISGYADGTFKPGNTLTGYAFMKMLLGALGYDQKIEGYVGENWSIAVAKQVQSLELADGNKNFNGTKPVTRQEACLYALNTLTCRPVKYADKGTSITINGAEIVTGASAWSYKYTDTSKLYMGELFGDDLVRNTGAADAFGRKATTWTYKDDEVGTYADTAKFVFTTEQDDDDIVAALKNYTLETYKMTDDVKPGVAKQIGYLNGTHSGSVYAVGFDTGVTMADALAGITSNGKLVEIYTSKNTITNIVAVTYDVAKVTSITTNSKGDVKYILEKTDKTTVTGTDFADKDKTDTIKLAADVKKGDMVTVATIGSAYYVYPTTTVTGVVTKSKASDYAIVDGTEYPMKGSATSADKDTQDLVVDQFGVIVKGDKTDKASDIVYVPYTWSKTSAYNTSVKMAQVVDQKGEVVEVEVDATGVQPTVGVYTYYMTADDAAFFSAPKVNEYVDVQLQSADLKTTTKKLSISSSAYYFDADVTFINVKNSAADLKVAVSTGLQEVTSANLNNSYIVINDTKDITAMFVPAGAAASVNKDDVLFMKDRTKGTSSVVDLKGNAATEYTFYKDGEKVYATTKTTPSNTTFYTYSVDSSTGRYNLNTVSENAYSAYVAFGDTTAIGQKKYLDDYTLAADCGIYDLTDEGTLTSLANIVAYVEANTTDVLDLYYLYDAKEEEVTTIYVVAR